MIMYKCIDTYNFSSKFICLSRAKNLPLLPKIDSENLQNIKNDGKER